MSLSGAGLFPEGAVKLCRGLELELFAKRSMMWQNVGD